MIWTPSGSINTIYCHKYICLGIWIYVSVRLNMIASYSNLLTVLILFTKVSRNLSEPNKNEQVVLVLKGFLGFDILFVAGGKFVSYNFPIICIFTNSYNNPKAQSFHVITWKLFHMLLEMYWLYFNMLQTSQEQ